VWPSSSCTGRKLPVFPSCRSSYEFEPPSFGATNACRGPNYQDQRAPPIVGQCGHSAASRSRSVISN
jgi:hypothetical protein